MHDSVKRLKVQLVGAALTVVVSAVALSATTYAWFVTNSRVHATTSTISAQANGMVLQIAQGKMLPMMVRTSKPLPARLVTKSALHRPTMRGLGSSPSPGRAPMSPAIRRPTRAPTASMC